MGIGSIIGGALGAVGSLVGGNQISQASKGAADYAKGIYSTEANSLAPYQSTGQGALYSLASLLGIGGATPPTTTPGSTATTVSGGSPLAAYNSFTQTPYYQFPLQQAMLAIQRSNSARGLTNSGATAKDLLQQATGYASSSLGSYLSQLSGVAGAGQNATTSLASTGVNIANQNANDVLTGAGAQAGALGTAIGDLTGSQGGLTPFLNGLTSGGTGLSPITPYGGGLSGNTIMSAYG